MDRWFDRPIDGTEMPPHLVRLEEVDGIPMAPASGAGPT